MSATLDSIIQTRRVSAEGDQSVHEASYDDRATLWTVNGGYLGASILCAAQDVAKFERPVNLTVQYLRPVGVGPVSIALSSVRKTSAAELLSARLSQADKHAVSAELWLSSAQGDELIKSPPMPMVPHPDELKSVEQIMEPDEPPRHKFWSVFDERPIHRIDSFKRRNMPGHSLRWMRYRDSALATPFIRAGATLPIIDMLGVTAASNARGGNILTSLAPTLSLTAHFYELDALDGWLLGDATAECVRHGMINTRVRIWSLTGALVAQGLTQMIMRPGEGVYVKPKS